MLTMEAAKKIGINACIDRLGRDFVQAHRNSAASAYSETDDGVFCFVGVDDNPGSRGSSDTLVLDSKSVFPYRVSCTVALEDGVPAFVDCVLPS